MNAHLRYHPLRLATLSLLTLGLFTITACGGDETGTDSYWETNEENQDQQEQQQEEQEQEEIVNELPPGSGSPPPIPVAIETVLHSPTTVTAGTILSYECRFLDAAGEPIQFTEDDPAPNHTLLRNPNNAFRTTPTGPRVERAGTASIACQAADLGLTDPDPIEILILPGDAHTTTATLDTYQMVAGDDVGISCEAYDAYGNFITDAAFNVLSDTSGSGIAIDNNDKVISITTTGLFTFSCQTQGVFQMFSDTLEVISDLPSELIVDLLPLQNVYRTGQIITLTTLVQDRFGNEITDANIDFSATPEGDYFGAGRFRFFEEGTYTLSAEVVGDTYNDVYLQAERQITVNETGPAIDCTGPSDGTMVNHTPGNNIAFSGAVSDENGVDQVTVNGTAVSLSPTGEFTHSVPTRYGINFVDITATDIFGEESVRTCSFLVSNHYHAPNSYIQDGVSLRLSQDAIDDGTIDGNLRSLNDLLVTVLNSEGLRQTILEGIQESHPFVESVWPCTFTIFVDNIRFTGNPHVTNLNLVGGGIELTSRFNNVAIDLTINSGWGCPGGSPTASVSWVDIDLTSNVGLSGNLPSISLREIDRVQSGSVSLSGGWSVLSFFFQGTFRGIVEDVFTGAIQENFDDLFTSLFESLDVDSLGTQIAVPRLDGSGDMNLNFGFQFSHANANSSRLLLGLAPRLTPGSGSAHSIQSLGVPHRGSPFLLAPPGDTASAAVHGAMLNQALHALWRGGLFHAEIGGALFGDDTPDGTTVQLETRLPPLVDLHTDGTATLMVGGMRLTLAYPGLFDDPITLVIGATGSTTISLDGDEISFAGIQIDEFRFSPEGISLNQAARDVLEDFLQGLIQNVFDQSLNAALPALPIPSFTINPDLGTYGLPVGSSLGLVNPQMEQTIRHLILRAEFGVQ